VEQSDGTLVLTWGEPSGGTRLTVDHAGRVGKPYLVMALDVDFGAASLGRVRRWLDRHGIGTLNVAGPRESSRPGAYADARAFLDRMLSPRPAPRKRPTRPRS
jgi:hypothetical protein